jgi:hypothetical protein
MNDRENKYILERSAQSLVLSCKANSKKAIPFLWRYQISSIWKPYAIVQYLEVDWRRGVLGLKAYDCGLYFGWGSEVVFANFH